MRFLQRKFLRAWDTILLAAFVSEFSLNLSSSRFSAIPSVTDSSIGAKFLKSILELLL